MTTTTTKRVATQESPSIPAINKKHKSLPCSFSSSYNPLEIKPLGNLFLNPSNRNTRSNGLGNLSVLPDELLLSDIFSSFNGEDLICLAGVSKAFFGWCFLEGLWKGIYITESAGRLLEWNGSWRSSYISTFIRPTSIPLSTPLPTKGITIPTLHSDVLFQPALSAAFNPRPLFLSNSFVPTISKIDGRNLFPLDLPTEPVILKYLMDDWKAIRNDTKRYWSLPVLSKRFKNTLFRAEATLTTLAHYETYHDSCEMDESPLYLFESEFVEKTDSSLRKNEGGEREEGKEGLGDDYSVPECFKEDLFEVMGSSRPDFRWLIVGPSRSGSTWHCDPNSTSAWNAVTTGSKAWVCFPPGITPPGVHVSEDLAEVSAPLSLAEWFISYYKEAKAIYGSKGVEGKKGLMREGICNAGEIFFVPSGWWHIVVNLEPSIAVTQNFVSRRELPSVLKFMRDRPEQVSGFKLAKSITSLSNSNNNDKNEIVIDGLEECDEIVSGVFESFIEALKEQKNELITEALKILEEEDVVKEKQVGEKVSSLFGESSEGFSFGFIGEDEEGDEDEDLIDL